MTTQEEVKIVWDAQRPRQAEDDVVNYLLSAINELDTPSSELINYDEENTTQAQSNITSEESKQILVQNIFDEIKNHDASLACGKRSSTAVEKLLSYATPKQLYGFFVNLTSYFGYL